MSTIRLQNIGEIYTRRLSISHGKTPEIYFSILSVIEQMKLSSVQGGDMHGGSRVNDNKKPDTIALQTVT